jgi:chorismate mutase/prephenate dehydratase
MSKESVGREQLDGLREGIDAIDREVLRLINERAQLARRIGALKQGNVYRPEREAQVLRRIVDTNPGPLPGAAAQRIFREIMSACLALEQPLVIAYLGPEGTFSETAAQKHFGDAPKLSPCALIDDVFRAVEAGNADYAVVPVENSTEGAVGRTLDLLLTSRLQICGEVNLRIHQNVLSMADSLSDIKQLYGHAQSLAQCHEWLNKNLGQLPRVPVASNAEGARLSAADPSSCAIAGEAAARRYGLNVLAANIEDDPNNTTRFLVLAAHDAGRSGVDKTSFVCSAPNQPGAVHALLAPMSAHGVSMTKFESRPARGFGGGSWEYVFYVAVEGHREDAAGFIKILGSYPRATY